MQVFLSTVCLIMWWAILIHLAVFIAFNSPWQILTLPANTTIWSRRWNRIATVNNNTWSWTWTWSDLSCGHFTIRSFSCCDTILLEKCENSCQKCATVLQLNTTTVGPGHRRRTWTPSHLSCLLSERWCGREEKILDPFHVVTQFCGNSCQKCANYFCRGGVNFIKCQNMCIVLNSNFNLNYFTFHLQISK